MNKEDLRRNVKKKLSLLSPKQRERISQKLSSNLLDYLKILNSKSPITSRDYIGCFAPMKDEFRWFLQYGEIMQAPALPQEESDAMMSFRACSWEEVLAGYGKSRTAHDGNLVVPKIVLVPGLAFTKSGKRLGRGAGYYDRYLAKRDLLKIGLCWEGQLLEELKTENHDILMDLVVTDKNIYIRGK